MPPGAFVRSTIDRLNRHATAILALAIFTGILWPQAASFLRPSFEATVVLMLTLSLATLDWGDMGRQARNLKLVAGILGWQLLLAPLAIWMLARLFGASEAVLYAAVMAAAAPPIVSVSIFAALVRLAPELSMVVVVSTFLALPFSLLILGGVLPDISTAISLTEFAVRVALFIGLPFVLAAMLRRALGREGIERARPGLAAAGMVNLIVFGIAVMDGVGPRVLAEPLFVLGMLGLAFLLNPGLQVPGAMLFWWRGRRDALTIGLCSGYRNMGLMWGITGGIGGPDFFLFVGLAQIPMYILPALLAPVYRHLAADRVS